MMWKFVGMEGRPNRKMKLKDYIKQEIKKGKREFNMGVEPNMEVNDKSLNRVKFKVKDEDL